MDVRKLVVVGGVAGGASCAARARRLAEGAEIVVFERGPHVSFANCGLPYHIGGDIKDAGKLLLQTPERLHRNHRLDVRVNSEVVAIDRAAKQVEVREGTTGRVYRESYDALVLSTGAAPLRPRLSGIDRPGLFSLRNIPDMEAILAWIQKVEARSAVVVGGGYIGLEMVEQLHQRGLRVAVAQSTAQVMAPLDPEMAALIHAELQSHGVALHLNAPAAGFEDCRPGEEGKAGVVVLGNGTRLPADVVILGLGVRPEVTLAREAGLEIGALGGVRVDDYLQTSDPSILAVGDAVEVRHFITGEWTLLPLAGIANRQGRQAADNLFGQRAPFPASQGTAILRVFTLAAACTGANEGTLRRAGIPFQAVHLHPASHAGYYPGAQPIALKVIFDPATGRLLGAQAVGADGADKRIDVLATAIRAGMTVEDVADLELCYAPPFGSAKDPVNLAGMIGENIRSGLVATAHWHEVADLDPAKTVVLDVREDAERRAGAIPGSLHIPLGELRGRLNELPREREIIVHCQSGQRSYSASRVLLQNGFLRVRNLSGSFKTWKAGTC